MTIEYVLRRIGLFAAIVFVAATLNFLLPRLRDSNPIEARFNEMAQGGGVNSRGVQEMIERYNAKFGFDKPLTVQYLNYWNDLVRLDFGQSAAFFPAEVRTEILRALPWTIGLLTVATVLAFGIGSLFGALISWPGMTRLVHIFVPILMTFAAIPYYLLGVWLIFLFGIFWPILPAGGALAYNVTLAFTWEAIVSIIRHGILPAASLVLAGIGFWALGMRGMMITTMGEDYMKLAEYKGLSPCRIFLWYGVRNAVLPQLTALAISVAFIFSGTVLVETVFAYPGIGSLLFRAIQLNDYLLMQGILMFAVLAIGVALLAIDLINPLIDPRISHGARTED